MEIENDVTTANGFDDVIPSSIKSDFNVAEHAQPESDDLSGKPLSNRLVATAPAVRKAAYLELAAILGGESGPPDAAAAAEHADHIPRLLADRAPLCHEGALDATVAWLRAAPAEAVGAAAGAVAKALMEKHAPGKYQPKAIAALLSLLRRGGAEPVQSALEAGVRSKAPKTCAAALKASAEALLECGAAAFDASPHLKQLPALLQHRDKSVREEAAALVGAMRLCLGDGVLAQLKGAPEDRINALREAPLPEPRAPLETDPSSTATDPTDTGAGAPAGAAAVAAPRVAMPPLDLLAKLPRSKGSKEPADAWEKQTLSDKWSERKAAADLVASLLEGQSSLKPADHGLVLRPLKRLYQDANVNVAASAIKATGLLAGLLGSDFSALARRTAPALLEKGADKKAVVAEAVRGCLAALSTGSCLTLAEAAELALAAMSRSTNTQLRSTAARWLAAAVSAADAEGVGRALDALDAPLQLLEEDATAEVRALGLEAAAAVGRKLPSEAAGAWLGQMPPKRAERVGKALGGGSGGGAAAAAPPKRPSGEAASLKAPAAAPARAPSAAPARPASMTAPSQVRPPARQASQPSVGGGRSSGAAADGAKKGGAPRREKASSGGGGGAGEERWREPDLPSSDDLPPALESEDLPPAAVRSAMADASWSARAQALGEVAAQAAGGGADALSPLRAELLLWQLGALLAKEKNEQVAARALEAVAAVAAAAPLVARRSAARVVGLAAEKLAAKKAKPAATQALLCLSEACGPSWVLAQLQAVAPSHKNPKVFGESLAAATAILAAFSTPALSASAAVSFAIPAFDSRDASVREAAHKLVVALCAAVGPALLQSPLLADVREVTRKQLAADAAKLSGAPAPPAASRFFKHSASCGGGGAPDGGGGGGGHGGGGAAVDELIPRVDLLRDKVKADTIAKLRSGAWKERKEALDVVAAALSESPRLGPVVGPLLEALAPRVADKQQVLAIGALNAIGAVGTGVGKAVRPHVRTTLPAVAVALGDGKAAIREAAMAALERWVAEVSFEPMLPLLPTALGMEAPAGRASALRWLCTHTAQLDGAAEVRPLLPPLLRNLDDRTPDVRAAAAAALEALLSAKLLAGDDVEAQLGELDTATAKKLRPAVAKLCRKTASPAPAGEPAAPLPPPARGQGPPARAVSLAPKPLRAAAAAGRKDVSEDASGRAATRPGLARSSTFGALPAYKSAAQLRAAAATSATAAPPPAASPAAPQAAPAVAPPVAAPPAAEAAAAEARAPAPRPMRPPAAAAERAAPVCEGGRARPPPTSRPTEAAAASSRAVESAPLGGRAAASSSAHTPRKSAARKGLADDVSTVGSQRSAEPDVLHALTALSKAVESSPEAVADVLPPLCEALCLRLRSALRAPSALPQCKKSLQLLIDLLGCVRLVGSLEQPQIRLLVLELLERLLDPCLADFGSETAQHLLESLNFIMLRLLQHSPRGPTLCALLQLLGEKAALPSQRELSALVLKCLAKLNKTLGEMARQIDLPPVVHALASLRATITAAERDAPTELLAQIRASSDATLAAIVEVRSAEVLGCLHGEVRGGATRTPRRAKVPASFAPLLVQVHAHLGMPPPSPARPRSRASAMTPSSLSAVLRTPGRSSATPRSLAKPEAAGAASPPPSRRTSSRAATPVRPSDKGTPRKPSAPATPGGSARRQLLSNDAAADATEAAGGPTVIASALARLDEMKKRYNIPVTPARAHAAAAGTTTASTPSAAAASIQKARAKIAKHEQEAHKL